MCCCFKSQDSAAVILDSAAYADSLPECATLIPARESMCERNIVSYRSLHKSEAKVSTATSGLRIPEQMNGIVCVQPVTSTMRSC